MATLADECGNLDLLESVDGYAGTFLVSVPASGCTFVFFNTELIMRRFKLRLLSKAALLKRFVFCTTVRQMKQQVVVSVVVIATFASAMVTYYDFNKHQFQYVRIARLLRLDDMEECATLLTRLKLAITAASSSMELLLPQQGERLIPSQRKLLNDLRVPLWTATALSQRW